MKRSSIFLTIFFISLLGFIGCATLNDYKAKTPDEEEIKTTLVKYFEEWDNHDADGVLSVVHEDAKMMTGGVDRLVLSKKQFSEYLPRRLKIAPKLEVGSPKMNVRGDEATVKVPFSGTGFNLVMTMELVKENGKWYILSSKY